MASLQHSTSANTPVDICPMQTQWTSPLDRRLGKDKQSYLVLSPTTTYLTTTQGAPSQMPPNTWPGKNCFASFIAPKLTTPRAASGKPKSVELLEFNFASRAFTYLRLAQVLSRSLSSFSSSMREYLDRIVKADKCAQYVDDIGIATHYAKELKTNLRDVFQCVREAGLRLTMAKCQFGAKKVEFLGRTVSPEGIALQADKITNFL